MRYRAARSRTRRRLIAGLAVVAGLGVAGTVVAAGSTNPSNGNTYEVVTTGSITWQAAKAAAEKMNLGGPLCRGHLATITSADESDFLRSTFGGTALNFKWLGGFQAPDGAEPNEGWSWITGEPWSYTDWHSGEPNNATGGNEDALVLYFGDGTWNDAPENYPYGPNGGYVVEFECRQVGIDIKPGSSPNSIQNNGHGVIPVAILTSDTFDASTVDPSTVALDGAAARAKGKSGNFGSLEDVDGDGDLDLVVQIQDTDGTYASGDTVAVLTGQTYDGEDITGSDTIRLVPPES